MSVLGIASGILSGGTSLGLTEVGSLMPEKWGGISGQINGLLSGGLTCLGSQAYPSTKFQADLNSFNTRANNVTNSQQLAELLSWCSGAVAQMNGLKWKSKCSIKNKDDFKKVLETFILTYGNQGFTKVKAQGSNFFNGETLNVSYEKYSTLVNYSVSITQNNTVPQNQTSAGITLDSLIGQTLAPTQTTSSDLYGGFSDTEKLQMQQFALSNGLTETEAMNKFFEGGIKFENGKIIWGVNATNQPSSNSNLLLVGGLVFLVYILTKK